MEEDREFKHVCKFCSKSFPCGRSLGGHMRSHMINDISAQTDGTMVTKKKLPPLNNSDGAYSNNNNNNNNTFAENSAYGLRENRKKKWRFADHSCGDDSHFDKFCKECGKNFQSWKALFGHMKCHSEEKEKLTNNNNSMEEQQDSWTGNNSPKLVMDSQSDNETAAPNRKRRSKRRIRYVGTANSSSLSFPNNASFSASEMEQEQEEVALCLMMLSRDVGQRAGLNSVAESSDNDSEFMEPNRVYSKNEVNISITNGVETKKLMEFTDKKFQIGKSQCEDSKLEVSKSEFSASEISRKGSIKNDRSNKSQQGLDDQPGVELVESSIKQPGLNQAEMLSKKCNLSKRKFHNTFDPELKSDSFKKPLPSSDLVDSEVRKNSDKSSKFECAACNKVFHSYQALGGHRASHKKIRGCFASKLDSSENSIETELSPDPTADSKLITSTTNGIKIDVLATDCDNKTEVNYGAKKSKGHECPVCLRVFPSGQALGGHKRSHLVGGTEAKSNQTNTTQEPNPAVRDFLDLNRPAPGEEESNGLVGFKNSWWIGSSHKHEALVGLISN